MFRRLLAEGRGISLRRSERELLRLRRLAALEPPRLGLGPDRRGQPLPLVVRRPVARGLGQSQPPVGVERPPVTRAVRPRREVRRLPGRSRGLGELPLLQEAVGPGRRFSDRLLRGSIRLRGFRGGRLGSRPECKESGCDGRRHHPERTGMRLGHAPDFVRGDRRTLGPLATIGVKTSPKSPPGWDETGKQSDSLGHMSVQNVNGLTGTSPPRE